MNPLPDEPAVDVLDAPVLVDEPLEALLAVNALPAVDDELEPLDCWPTWPVTVEMVPADGAVSTVPARLVWSGVPVWVPAWAAAWSAAIDWGTGVSLAALAAWVDCSDAWALAICCCAAVMPCESFRSEEHTSELQSLRHLVCRLLL